MAETYHYHIRIQGILDRAWQDWFDGMTISPMHDAAETLLSGDVRDQAALYGMLNRIRDLNLTLIALYRVPRNPAILAAPTIHDPKEVHHVS